MNGVLVAVVPATWPACDWPVPLPPPPLLPPPPPPLLPPGLVVPGLLLVVQPSGGGNPGIGKQVAGGLVPGGMQKVSSGEGRQVLDGGVPGGMQKEFKGEGRHVGELLGVAGGMQNELSGVGRQPLLGGLVGGLLLGATGSHPPRPGKAVPPTHDPVPDTPMGSGGLHPLTGAGSQTDPDWVTDVWAGVSPGIKTDSMPITTLPGVGMPTLRV